MSTHMNGFFTERIEKLISIEDFLIEGLSIPDDFILIRQISKHINAGYMSLGITLYKDTALDKCDERLVIYDYKSFSELKADIGVIEKSSIKAYIYTHNINDIESKIGINNSDDLIIKAAEIDYYKVLTPKKKKYRMRPKNNYSDRIKL